MGMEGAQGEGGDAEEGIHKEVVKARFARVDIVKEMWGSLGRRLWKWVERVE